jgi:hypothetical protein
VVGLIQTRLDAGRAVADDARRGRADVDVVEDDAAAVDVLTRWGLVGGREREEGEGEAYQEGRGSAGQERREDGGEGGELHGGGCRVGDCGGVQKVTLWLRSYILSLVPHTCQKTSSIMMLAPLFVQAFLNTWLRAQSR